MSSRNYKSQGFERILAAPLVESFERLFSRSLNLTIASYFTEELVEESAFGAPTLGDSYHQGVGLPKSLLT
jgi:hypothetical protein